MNSIDKLKKLENIIRWRLTGNSTFSPEPIYQPELAEWANQLLGIIYDLQPDWRPMETAPRDGTMLRLLVRFTEHPTEDDEVAPTIGAYADEGNPDGAWQFAGWCWTHDHFTEGKGVPIAWLPLLDGLVSKPIPEDALGRILAHAEVLNERDRRRERITWERELAELMTRRPE